MNEKSLLLDAVESGEISAETLLRACFSLIEHDDLVELCEKFNLYNYDDGVLYDEL